MVVNAVAKQGQVAACIGAQRTLVDDGATAVAAEDEAAIGKVGLRQIQRGGHQPTHIDLGARGKQHAVGVGQEDLAIGLQLAVDLGAAVAHHAVQRDRRCAGLTELHGRSRADVETLPVQSQALAGLVDDEQVGALLQLAAAHLHLAAHGQGRCRHLRIGQAGTAQHRREQPRQQARQARPAPLLGPAPGGTAGALGGCARCGGGFAGGGACGHGVSPGCCGQV